MADDGDWVEDVKRWYFAGVQASAAQTEVPHSDYGNDLGYEAAHPALQAHHWPDAASLASKR